MGLRAEVRRLPEWLDGAGPKVNLTLFGLILGVVLPWAMGFQYLDPMILMEPFRRGSGISAMGQPALRSRRHTSIRRRVDTL